MVASVNSKFDPNKLYAHQTWVRFAKGQTLVGVNESDTDFATAGKTGGAKTHTLTTAQIPAHTHGISSDDHYVLGSVGALTRHSCASGTGQTNMLKSANSAVERMWKNTLSVGSGAAHNNLQPYVTVYYWKRTA